ncbi:MAG TPA: dockerin type I domain-containing protein, partial [Candidatus Glassbacteria bacterium]|nr:dockerin type I domain-containing protein [Candidatus Glassbacteria bacterium]
AARGDGPEDELAALSYAHQAQTLSFRTAPTCWNTGDVDSNDRTDVFDLLAMLRVISHQVEPTDCSDLNRDGRTDIFDLITLLGLI